RPAGVKRASASAERTNRSSPSRQLSAPKSSSPVSVRARWTSSSITAPAVTLAGPAVMSAGPSMGAPSGALDLVGHRGSLHHPVGGLAVPCESGDCLLQDRGPWWPGYSRECGDNRSPLDCGCATFRFQDNGNILVIGFQSA